MIQLLLLTSLMSVIHWIVTQTQKLLDIFNIMRATQNQKIFTSLLKQHHISQLINGIV